jgi:hypothetical protein
VLFIQKWVIILSNGFAYSASGQAQLAVIQNALAHKPTHFFCHPLPNDAEDSDSNAISDTSYYGWENERHYWTSRLKTDENLDDKAFL